MATIMQDHMDIACLICGFHIDAIERMYGRISRYKHGEAHIYCINIEAGKVPECPLADNVTPKPCTNLCVQAQECSAGIQCNCRCDNLLCQIGQSVRALRSKGMIRWKGYVPREL